MKKARLIIAMLVIAVLSVQIFTVSAAYGDNTLDDNFHSEYKVGDVNDDGDIDICDLVRMKRYSEGNVNSYSLVYDAADCDGNGRVDANSDMTALRKYLLGISELGE